MKKEIVKTELEILKFNESELYFSPKKYEKDFLFFNMFFGGRGIGKTFNFYRYLIDNFLETKKQFMLVRRTSAQLDPETLFGEIVNYYPNVFEFHKEEKQLTRILIDGEICCFLASVSTSYNVKGHAYPHCDIVYFDEFLADLNERPVKNEVFAFISLLDSVFRLRKNCKVFLSANTVTLDNIYFDYFKILLDDIKEDSNIQFNNISIFNLKSSNVYMEEKVISDLGKLTQNTEYFNYAYGGGWLKGTGNINYISSELVKYVNKKKDMCFYFGGDYYYKIANLGKYSCNTFIYLDTRKSEQTFTPFTALANKKIKFIDYSNFMLFFRKLEKDFKENTLKFDCIRTYNRLIKYITMEII